jgi:hypothetical protein
VNSYAEPADQPVGYTGCTLYGPSGSTTGAPCTLPYEVLELQPVTADTIYVPRHNQIVSVSSGSGVWISGDPDAWLRFPIGAVTASQVVFVSGVSLLVQTY